VAYYSDTFEGIGVLNQVTVTDRGALPEAARIARAEVRALDEACSRFRDDSELSLLNRSQGRPVAVGALLFDAVLTALLAAEQTGGLVDPTVGRSLGGIGYDRDFDLVVVPGSTPSFAFVPAAGWEGVVVDHVLRTITLPLTCELDLGATAKALAADRVAVAVHAATGSPVLVSLGGDVSVQGAPDGGWPIAVADSHRHAGAAGQKIPGQTIALWHGGLATSSTTVRRWSAAGVDMHHVVNPTTGAPAAGPWRTISVAAESCVAANTAATAAIVRGAAACAQLDERGLAARLVGHDGTVCCTDRWPGPRRPRSARASQPTHSHRTEPLQTVSV
jgi:FAD:protein FMN transferase